MVRLFSVITSILGLSSRRPSVGRRPHPREEGGIGRCIPRRNRARLRTDDRHCGRSRTQDDPPYSSVPRSFRDHCTRGLETEVLRSLCASTTRYNLSSDGFLVEPACRRGASCTSSPAAETEPSQNKTLARQELRTRTAGPLAPHLEPSRSLVFLQQPFFSAFLCRVWSDLCWPRY